MRLSLFGTLPGDDRLEQKGRGPRYDVLRCWLVGADFDLADAAKRADNSVTGALDSHQDGAAKAVAGGSMC
jgi:hypothetical protein